MEILNIIILICTIHTGDKDYPILLKQKKDCIKELLICQNSKLVNGLEKCLTQ
jgi:hypothetical protein